MRVLLADDEARVREAMRALLEEDPRLNVVASVGTAVDAADAAAEHQPDLAVVDVRMPGGGHAAVVAIRKSSPRTVVLVCTSYDDKHTRASMQDAGAHAFIVKGTEDLLDVARDLLGLSV